MDHLRTFGRGLILRCPNCGQPKLFRQWLRMTDRCPGCGLFFEREEGYWSGAVAINTVVTELIFITMMVIVVVFTWPDIPLVPLLIAAVILNGIVPLIFYPASKTLWVATDLILHPLEEQEEHEVASLRINKQRFNPDGEPAP